MRILGIETSCDDTAAAVVGSDRTIHSSVVSSQTEYHRKYGGIVPEIASRTHLDHIMPVIGEALEQARVSLGDIAAIAVTQGPGLVGSLLVGINVAKALAYARGIPLVGINHLEGHLLAPLLHHTVPFPHVSLVVSGGHTNLYDVQAPGTYTRLGQTRDDAAGEAFDKVAKLLGLGYPGGVVIDRLAEKGTPDAIAFPRPMIRDGSLDFSFSGLKTAVRYHLDQHPLPAEPESGLADIAASFQAAVVDILVQKTLQAARTCAARAITISGGVAANRGLRRVMQNAALGAGIPLFIPRPDLCTDNAAMIAAAAIHRLACEVPFPFEMNARSRLQL